MEGFSRKNETRKKYTFASSTIDGKKRRNVRSESRSGEGRKHVLSEGRFPKPEVLRQNLRQVPTCVTFNASQKITHGWVGWGGRGNAGGVYLNNLYRGTA